MDWLLEIRDSLEEGVFDSLVLDFVTEDEDEPVARGVNGMPLTSEDTDDDEGKRSCRLLQGAGPRTVAMTCPSSSSGMVVTMDGIPIRVWCRLGNTNDAALIRQVKATCGTVACRRSSSGSPTAASP